MPPAGPTPKKLRQAALAVSVALPSMPASHHACHGVAEASASRSPNPSSTAETNGRAPLRGSRSARRSDPLARVCQPKPSWPSLQSSCLDEAAARTRPRGRNMMSGARGPLPAPTTQSQTPGLAGPRDPRDHSGSISLPPPPKAPRRAQLWTMVQLIVPVVPGRPDTGRPIGSGSPPGVRGSILLSAPSIGGRRYCPSACLPWARHLLLYASRRRKMQRTTMLPSFPESDIAVQKLMR
ncbi:hypothetical protein GQ53DRAFT_456913 [Thozetella sp. PMI_491]|nr:hypothetical protein GQ53DRAFT_456913 [Thozetella sp. PMI_491]